MKLKELYENEDKYELYNKWASGAITDDKRELLIPLLLHELKAGNVWFVRDKIKSAREHGYDYPEFKAIEKSMGTIKEERAGAFLPIGDSHPAAFRPAYKHVEFSNKDEFVKALLIMLKRDYIFAIKYWIDQCRRAGYDYPEFKTIEKSLDTVKEERGGYTISTSDGLVTFGEKEKFIRFLLKYIKAGNDFEHVKWWIKMARDDGHDYPEFKTIEKSIGKINEEQFFVAKGQSGVKVFDTDEEQDVFIEFHDKKKFLKFILGVLKHNSDKISHKMVIEWINAARNFGCDYPEFKAIEKSIGKLHEEGRDAFDLRALEMAVNPKGFYTLDIKTRQEVYIRYSDHHAFIKYLLQRLKHRGGDHEVRYRIQMCRGAGYEYPEFEAIEKSLGPIEEGRGKYSINGGNPDDGIPVWGWGVPSGVEIVKFKDKEKFIKLCLYELKNGSISEVKHWIRMCRECGYDYPEFKVIEKSIGKEE